MADLKIEYVDIGELKTYANNAKIHTAEQIEQIKKSIEEFGMNDPIAVWKNNEIIEGHGRMIACNELGIKKVPVVRLDKLSDEQRRAYMLVHNKLTMNTGFDFSALSNELKELDNIDMSDFGFGYFEMNVDDEEIIPDGFDGDMLKEYGEGKTQSTVITIVCTNEEEIDFMKEILKEDNEELRKLYRAESIIERYEEDDS